MKPFVSVIIPTYHDWERLKMCLTALRAQTYPQGRFEVVVVNNDPQDPVPEMDFPPNFQILSESKPGSYAARNKGISVANGEILAFTDSDCIPREDWIEKAVNNFLEGAQRIAGHVELFFRSDKLNAAEIFEKAFGFNQEANASTGSSYTANMIVGRNDFQIVGFFNENLMSCGDNEWSLRAQASGIPIIYADDVVVRHPARSSMKELMSKKKRVAGGLANISKDIRTGPPLWALRGFLPSVRVFLSLAERKDLSSYEKVVSFFVHYFLKIYLTVSRILVLLGLEEPQRN